MQIRLMICNLMFFAAVEIGETMPIIDVPLPLSVGWIAYLLWLLPASLHNTYMYTASRGHRDT